MNLSSKLFTTEDFLLLPNDPLLSYRERRKDEPKGIAWGQRKLGMMLIQFLNFHWDPLAVPKPIIVYVGAAPGTNIEYIASKCFPMAEYHLYDPRFPKEIGTEGRFPREIANLLANVKYYSQLFTDEDARKWANRNDVFLISDIRSSDKKKEFTKEQEEIILRDNNLQMSWFNIIRPVKACFKFRLSFPLKGLGVGLPDNITYLSGLIFKGIYAPPSSTETRLVPDGKMTNYSALKYESQMFYFNTVIRTQQRYINPFVTSPSEGLVTPVDYPELLLDYESSAETEVWRGFLNKMNLPVTKENVIAFSRDFTNYLNRYFQTNPTTLDKLRKDPNFIKRNFRGGTEEDE